MVVCDFWRSVARRHENNAPQNTKTDGHGDAHRRAREIRLGQIMESITHARALTVGAGRGGGGGVGGHEASEQSDVVVGRQPCDERAERELALVAGRRAEGELENVRRAVRASCAFFPFPPPPPRPPHSCIRRRTVGGGNSVM